MRRHGLEWPPDLHQVGAFLFFAFLASGAYAFYLPLVDPPAARWALVTIYSVLLACVLLLTIITSATDPSDPGVLPGGARGDLFCALCQAHVQRSSKHCRACNRCVHGFDHHCSWLNNCVGAANYRPFFCLLCATLCLLLLQLAWGAWLFARSFYAADSSQALLAAAYPSFNFQGWQGLVGIFLLLLLAALLLLGELFSFHAVLVLRNMTTYDFIMAQRQAGGAAPQQPGTGGAHGSGPGGAQEMLCRSNQIADAAGPGPRQKPRVGLNPCLACQTEKQPGATAGPAPGLDPGGGAHPTGVAGIWTRGLQGAGFTPPRGYNASNWPAGLTGGWSSPYTYAPAAGPTAPPSRSPQPGPGQLPISPQPGPGQLPGSPSPAGLQAWQLARATGGAAPLGAAHSPTTHHAAPAQHFSSPSQRPLNLDGSPWAPQQGAAGQQVASPPPTASRVLFPPPAGMQGAGTPSPPSHTHSPGPAPLLQHAGGNSSPQGTSHHLGTSRGSSPLAPASYSPVAGGAAPGSLPAGSPRQPGGAAGTHLGSRASGVGAAAAPGVGQGWSTHSMHSGSSQLPPTYTSTHASPQHQPTYTLTYPSPQQLSPQQPVSYALTRSPSGAVRLPPLSAYSPG